MLINHFLSVGSRWNSVGLFLFFLLVSVVVGSEVQAQTSTESRELLEDAPASDVLSPEQWKQVDQSVQRALLWLASQQQRDGSFPTLPQGQPGVTSLCVMAFLTHGHLPGEGPYGQKLEKAIDFIRLCQKQNGLLAVVAPGGPRITRNTPHEIGVSAVYNHTISSLLLSEVYSLEGSRQADRLQSIIEKSLQASLLMQNWPKQRKVDRGGWRYLHPFMDVHSDLSLTGWQLMFLRSAKNAGFVVEQKPIDEAVAYVRRCFNSRYGTFEYTAKTPDQRSRGMAGAGVLALAHAGFHNSIEAQKAGEWILQHPFDQYNKRETFTQTSHYKDRYHYGVFNCCQAMYQLGGRHWRQFYPRTVKTLLANQRENGSWPAEDHPDEKKFGSAYTTSLMVLSLGAANQLLPIFQR